MDTVAEKRRVALILDNSTAHNVQPKLTAVSLKFLPANTTAKSQPLLDQAVITTVKARYKNRICERALLNMQQHEPLKMDMRGAIDTAVGSWWQVKSTEVSILRKLASCAMLWL